VFQGQLIDVNSGGVDDGVNYARPDILPGWLRREMDSNETLHQTVTEALRESAASQYVSQFGDPYAQNWPITPVTEDPLMEWPQSTREIVLNNCHAAYARNPLAYAGVQFTALFTIGDGFNLDCKHPEVEEVLQAFIDNPDNAIKEYEQQAMVDLQVDGELILRLFREGDETVIAPQRPWELAHIETELGNFRRMKSFHFEYQKSEGDSPAGRTTYEPKDVAAEDIIFVAINRHSYELRGRPELYRLLPWLRADSEWLSDRARQSKWRNALLWVINVANATPAAIAAVSARWRKAPSPGSVAVESANVTVNAATNSSSAADQGHDGRAIRLINVLGFLMAEYMFGDGENANLATATKQELPALAKFEFFQQIMIERLWTPLFRRVLAAKFDETYMLTPQDADGDVVEGEKPIRAIDAFEVTYEPVTQQDIQALSNALNMQAMNGWISDKTAQEKLGLDPHIEAKRLKAEQEQKRDEMAQGMRPVPPGFEQAFGDTGDDEDVVKSEQNGKQPEAA
jgi:hypothetical protein